MNDPRFDPLPSDSAKHLDRFVRDLAWGALNNKWRNAFYIQGIPAWRELELLPSQNPDLKEYLAQVWDNHPPDPAQLEDLGYIVEVPGSSIGDDTSLYKLTEKGLRFARSTSPGPIFISYRRLESSSFALLLSDRLKIYGLAPFLDNQTDKEDQGIALKPGDKWEDELRDAIKARQYFVVLVGPTTLSSNVVCREIEYALAFHKKIIPIWHRGFDPRNKEHFPESLSSAIRNVITDINGIQVTTEDPLQYEVAIERLLALFGITH